MDRDKLLESYRKELDGRSERYFYDTFHMPKDIVVSPNAAWNLDDLRQVLRGLDESQGGHKATQIHAEIWARTLALISNLHNHVVRVLRDGGTPESDMRVQDHLAAINLISLQYGVLYNIDQTSRLEWTLIHDEGLSMHVPLGGSLPRPKSAYPYEVALSFAGEDRAYVGQVAQLLRETGRNVFYDEFETAKLWGKDLYQYLNKIYRDQAMICLVFVSSHYARKLWTSHELKSLQARALSENREYVLPVRFDDTALPGLNDTVAYIDATKVSPKELVALTNDKLDTLWPDESGDDISA